MKVNQASNAPAKPTLSKEELRKQAAELRKLTAPMRKRIEQAEGAIEKISDKLASVEEKLADTGLYEDSRKSELLALLDEQTQLQQQQAQFEDEMLSAMTELEMAEEQATSVLQN